MKIALRLSATVLALSFSTAEAGMTIEQYNSTPRNDAKWEFFKIYVKGASDAYMVANEAANRQVGHYLFCMPETLALTADLAIQLLDKQVKELKHEKNSTVDLFLYVGLVTTFPCKS